MTSHCNVFACSQLCAKTKNKTKNKSRHLLSCLYVYLVYCWPEGFVPRCVRRWLQGAKATRCICSSSSVGGMGHELQGSAVFGESCDQCRRNRVPYSSDACPGHPGHRLHRNPTESQCKSHGRMATPNVVVLAAHIPKPLHVEV
jgi:hypothetical protein